MAEVDRIITDLKFLRQVSRPTTMEEVLDLNLIERLKASCKTAWVNGHGLAAIQIGIPIKFGWFMNGSRDVLLLNPEIITKKGKISLKNEGCLSIPNLWHSVKRHEKIKYTSDGESHTVRGKLAHIIQHEVDHMDGIVDIDIAARTWNAVVNK